MLCGLAGVVVLVVIGSEELAVVGALMPEHLVPSDHRLLIASFALA